MCEHSLTSCIVPKSDCRADFRPKRNRDGSYWGAHKGEIRDIEPGVRGGPWSRSVKIRWRENTNRVTGIIRNVKLTLYSEFSGGNVSFECRTNGNGYDASVSGTSLQFFRGENKMGNPVALEGSGPANMPFSAGNSGRKWSAVGSVAPFIAANATHAILRANECSFCYRGLKPEITVRSTDSNATRSFYREAFGTIGEDPSTIELADCRLRLSQDVSPTEIQIQAVDPLSAPERLRSSGAELRSELVGDGLSSEFFVLTDPGGNKVRVLIGSIDLEPADMLSMDLDG